MSGSLVHTPSASLPSCLFSCRIVKIDFYMTPPVRDLDICYSQFRSNAIEKVPVIRIFGSTPSGQKTCLHMHGVFPYIYLPCVSGDVSEGYLQQLSGSIDHALQVSLGSGSKPVHHVFKAVLVKGIPFYGYHKADELFIKVYLYNPMLIKRLSDLLLAGAVMNTSLQPHEAHIPFPLQFMIDYNLYGMNHLHLAAVKFRIIGEEAPTCTTPHASQSHSSPLSPSSHMSLLYNPTQTHWDTTALASDMVLSVPRQSVCELEVDALAADILNRHELSLVSDGYPGLAAIWEEERQRRELLNIELPLSPPPSPERGSQFVHRAEARLKAHLDQLVQEKLGEGDSISSEEEAPPIDDSHPLLNCTQSCDPDVHRPVHDSPSDDDMAIKENVGVVVDKVAVEHSMEMSQRLSADTIYKSTDAELLDLILDLCQTPINLTQGSQRTGAHPLSQSLYCSQSVGQSLVKKMERSHSVVSERSLFSSSPSPVTSSPIHKHAQSTGNLAAEVSVRDESNDIEKQKYFSSKEKSSHVLLEKGAIAPVQSINVSGMEAFLDSSLDTSIDDDVVNEQTFSGRFSKKQITIRTESSLLQTADYEPLNYSRPKTGSNPFKQSTKEPNLVTDMDLVIPSSRLSSPLPLSPRTQELQSLVAESFESHHSSQQNDSKINSGDFELGFDDIPCGQVAHSQPLGQEESNKEISLSDVDPNWNPISDTASDSQSPFKYKPTSKVRLGSEDDVQLEYDMPEIDILNSRVSDDSLAYSLDANSYGSQIHQKVETGHSSRPLKQFSTSSLRSQLLKLCSPLYNASGVECESGEGVSMVEGDKCDDGDSEAEESFLMSQQVWDDVEKQSHQSASDSLDFDLNLPAQKSSDVGEDECSHEHSDDFIPQLDGNGGGQPLKKRKLKKTLGVRREGTRFQTKQTGDTELSDSAACTNTNSIEQCSSKGDNSSVILKDASETSTVKGTGNVSPQSKPPASKKKSRVGLSLKKRPSLRATGNDSLFPIVHLRYFNNHNKESFSKSTKLKKQALSNSFSLKLTKIPIVRSSNSKSDSSQSFSDTSSNRNTHKLRAKRSRGEEFQSDPIFSKEKKARLAQERNKRYKGRCYAKGASPDSDVGMSYEEQLKLAVEQSLKTHVMDIDESSKADLSEKRRSTSSDVDLNRTVIEESPIAEDDCFSDKQDDVILKSVDKDGGNNAVVELSDKVCDSIDKVDVPGDISDELDTSFCSIPESPPFVVSELNTLQSDLQLQIDTSTISIGSPVHTSSQDKSTEGVQNSLHFSPIKPTIQETQPKTVVAVVDEIPTLQSLSTDVLSFSAALHLASPGRYSIDSPVPLSHGSNEEMAEIDFHLAISSESEGEFAHEESMQVEEQSGLSVGHFRTSVTLKKSEEENVGVCSPLDKSIPREIKGVCQEDCSVTSIRNNGMDQTASELDTHRTHTNGHRVVSGIVPEPSKDHRMSKDSSHSNSSPPFTLEQSTVLQDRLRLTSASGHSSDMVVLKPSVAPPTPQDLMSSLSTYGLPSGQHVHPFYSNPEDVQQAREIGGRISIKNEGVSDSVQFSMTGLQQMRVVLSMLSTSLPGTQQSLPPVCHPIDRSANRLSHYTADDHKRDIKLRSGFHSNQTVVITPTKPPPSSAKVKSTLKKPIKSTPTPLNTNSQASENVLPKTKNNRAVLKRKELDSNAASLGAVGPPNKATPLVTNSPSMSVKSSGSIKSDTSDVDTTGGMDASLTSYQVPKCMHSSTPMVSGEAGGGCVEVSGEPGDRAKDEMTPVRKSQVGRVKDARKRQQFPFTPIISRPKREASLLEGPTPNNTYGFKISQSALPGKCDNHQVQYLTCMSIEVHVKTRGNLRPDPEMDSILALFYYVHNDWPTPNPTHLPGGNSRLGIIAIDLTKQTLGPHTNSPLKKVSEVNAGSTTSPDKAQGSFGNKDTDTDSSLLSSCMNNKQSVSGANIHSYLDGCGVCNDVEVTYVTSEVELLDKLVCLVRETDPDILMGYELTMLSWGYCMERASHLNINLTNKLSRMPNLPGVRQQVQSEERSWWGNASNVQVLGRITLNVWKLMRHEIALNVYSFENVTYHVLHQRVPLYSFKTLTYWYDHHTKLYRHRVVEHYLKRCQGNHQLLESFNVIGRTSEFARLYGIEFENVIDRGSQYRVESMMLRLAKPANYIAVSPSVQQRARMAAPECLPLILEPESTFYADPVLVLDFQSLYPSMVIAYNYCYSTCLGRVQNLALHGDYTFGATSLNVPNNVLKKLKDRVHISPNGVVFVKSNVRRGIMPRMLKEILGTRIMVKSSMKQHKANKALNRMLDARQMGLKLIANVTYGYTAANFSGRMPCVEIADSIVRKGRETLERAIELVNSTPEWGGRVVYGDTDSLFVLLKGASKEEAFRIGKEITDRVTADNPTPVKLKFEKVYMPCILQTKKRYVGYMYETLDQSEPVFDAKGIETVRRDGCPAVAKVLEKSLGLLFTSRDLSQVKTYVQRQCGKLLEGRVNLQDYTFAKEYRGRQFYRPGACVPALELAKRGLLVDKRSEPRSSERVPYVIVYGTPGQPLIQLVRKPDELLENPGLRLNGMYYITKQILPALDRAFSLMGVNVRQWYDEMPRVFRAPVLFTDGSKKPRGTIGQYFATMHCPVCNQLTVEGVCVKCKRDPQTVAITLGARIHNAERSHAELSNLCKSCVGSQDPEHFSKCVSFDCPVLYRRTRAELDLSSSESLRTLLSNSLP